MLTFSLRAPNEQNFGGNYRAFIDAVRLAFRTGDFVVRINPGEGDDLWIQIRGNDLYTMALSTHAVGDWWEIPELQQRYHWDQDIQINRLSIQTAVENARRFYQRRLAALIAQRGAAQVQPLLPSTIPILAFVISEAARFELVELCVDALIRFRGQRQPITWQNFQEVCTSWEHQGRYMAISLSVTERYLRGLQNQHGLQYIYNLIEGFRAAQLRQWLGERRRL